MPPPPRNPDHNPDDGDRRGRPTKLTDALIRRAVALLRRFNFRGVVARRLGVNARTFERWMRLGEEHAGRFPDSIYLRFRREVLAAEAYAEDRALQTIEQDGHAVDARHLEWLLERKYPQRWGRYRGELGLLKRQLAARDKTIAALRKRIADLAAAVGVGGGKSADPAVDGEG